MKSTNNLFLEGFSGRAGNLVVKNYSGKLVITKVADMSKRVLSEKQKRINELMSEANVIGKKILANPELKKEACEALNVEPNKVFRTFVKEYIKRGGEDYILPSMKRSGKVNSGDPQDHIAIDPEVMDGKAVIKNTTVTVEEILDRLSRGDSFSEILASYPVLRTQDILAALAFAAKLASI